MVDVLLLAGLYTLRVLAGIAAAQVRFSTWLLAFSMFLFLSLAFLKRFTEVSAMEGAATEQVRRRGYIRGDREWLGSMGSASGYLSVLVLALYINSEQVMALYRTPLLLWLVCPLLLFWTSRMWLLAHRGRIHDDPIVATVRDPASYVIGALVALMLYLALYGWRLVAVRRLPLVGPVSARRPGRRGAGRLALRRRRRSSACPDRCCPTPAAGATATAASTTAALLLDVRRLDRLIAFDASAGLLRCEAGVTLAEILALDRAARLVPAGGARAPAGCRWAAPSRTTSTARTTTGPARSAPT